MSTALALDEKGTLPGNLPRRLLGKTGERVPILGLGTAPGGLGMEDGDAIALYHRAIDLGVTYLDTAPGYGRAQVQLGAVMGQRRDEVFLVTKTATSKGCEALRILEQSLRELQTDQVDLTYVHTLGNQDVDEVLAPDGSLAGLRQAQSLGMIRYVGFSSHNAPWKAAKVLREAEVDATLLAFNFADRYTYNFEHEGLPLAVERNVGVAAMKVYGGAEAMKYETLEGEKRRKSALGAHGGHNHELALRYALSLPGVALAVIGMYTEEELLQNIAWSRRYLPLTSAEELYLQPLGRRVAADWGAHYGSPE